MSILIEDRTYIIRLFGLIEMASDSYALLIGLAC